jgi:hypothetical protein
VVHNPRVDSHSAHLRPEDPTHAPIAPPAVDQDPAKLPLQFGLRLQEFHPQSLRGSDEARLVSWIDRVGLLDQAVGVSGSFGDGVDGPLEDLSFVARHSEKSRFLPHRIRQRTPRTVVVLVRRRNAGWSRPRPADAALHARPVAS